MEGKWIRLASGYWRYVVFVLIDKRDNLYGCFMQRRSDSLHHLGSF